MSVLLAVTTPRALPGDWTTPQNDALWLDLDKTVFDPCPEGWRVPRGGANDLCPWSAFTIDNGLWNGNGVNLAGGRFWNNTVVYGGVAWYPSPGYRDFGRAGYEGVLRSVGNDGYSWSSSVSGTNGVFLHFHSSYLNPSDANNRGHGFQVRCLQE